MIPPLRASKNAGRDDSENKFKRTPYIVRSLGFRQRARASGLLFAFHSIRTSANLFSCVFNH